MRAAIQRVREAVVIAREDEPGEKRLVGYVIAQEGADLSAFDLRTQLLSLLAEYMVPSAFVTMASFPLTANGKLDRRALPAPQADAYASREYEAPRGEIEEALGYGVVKMNVDTDTQYAFTRPVAGHMFVNYDGVLKIDGEVGEKKAYDPRSYMKKAEANMCERVVEACNDLHSAGRSISAG